MRGYGEISERLRRSTVQVRLPDGRGEGSGVVWDSSGVIVTNAHVARAPRAEVEFWDGRRAEAGVIARDARRDLAVLRVDLVGLESCTPGDSSLVRAGEIAIAVGNPLGFAGAVSVGVIHSTGPLVGMGRQQWIRADVRLAPGNSGGPLANARGQVIGINTAIVNGLGVAAPSNAVADLLRGGAQPSLGVTLRPVHLGMQILAIEPGSVAEAASLKPGDVLLGSLDDLWEALDSGSDVLRLRFLRGDGRRVRETYARLQARAEAA
jgi:serine protease Do